MAKTFNYKGRLVDDPVDHELGRIPIGRLLFKMSVPMMVSMFMLACYNVVDSIFVSRISEAALAALSFSYPIQFLMVALNIGTNVGVTALISRSLGEKNFENANEYARHGLLISFTYYIIFALLGYFFTDNFFHAITTDKAIQIAGIDYLSIITVFSLGFFVETTYEKIMQANGKSVCSMITQLSGAIFNIVFDPILIFGLFGFPAMGTKGAAIATVGGQFFGVIIGFILNKFVNSDIDSRIIKFNIQNKIEINIKPKLHILKNIYKVGLPSIIMQSVSSFTILGLNLILTKYESAVAVLGVYYKIQSFIFMPVYGLNNGMVPIVSYNFGSHNKDRILSVIKSALFWAALIMTLGALILFFIPDKILRLFNANSTMLNTGIHAFKVIALHFPLVSSNIILNSVMQATKKEIYSLSASLIRQVVILLPAAYILSNLFDLNGVWYCFLISEFIAFLVTLYLYEKTYHERIKVL